MNVTTIIDPQFEPVTLAEVYKVCRLDPDGSPATHEHDLLLTGYITTARQYVEAFTRRSLIEQTKRLSTASFGNGNPLAISLWYPPIISINRVQYYDGTNVLTTVDPSNYFLTDDELPQVMFIDGFAAPTTSRRPDAVRVEYQAGYAANSSPAVLQSEFAALVPQDLKDAILLRVQYYYEDLAPNDRESLNTTIEAIMTSKKVLLTP
jgi:uncharacterized phiE125 gp8 family phage protein